MSYYNHDLMMLFYVFSHFDSSWKELKSIIMMSMFSFPDSITQPLGIAEEVTFIECLQELSTTREKIEESHLCCGYLLSI